MVAATLYNDYLNLNSRLVYFSYALELKDLPCYIIKKKKIIILNKIVCILSITGSSSELLSRGTPLTLVHSIAADLVYPNIPIIWIAYYFIINVDNF